MYKKIKISIAVAAALASGIVFWDFSAMYLNKPDLIVIEYLRKQWLKSRRARVLRTIGGIKRLQQAEILENECFIPLAEIFGYSPNSYSDVVIHSDEWIAYQDPQDFESYSCDFILYQFKPQNKYESYLKDRASSTVSSSLLKMYNYEPGSFISIVCEEKKAIPNEDVWAYVEDGEVKCSDNSRPYTGGYF